MEMDTAEWALVISYFSFVIAALSFVWTVWSHFIYPKPKLKVHICISQLYPNTGQPHFVQMVVTNYGPGPARISSAAAFIKRRFFPRENTLALINPLSNFPHSFEDSNGPFSGGIPAKIEAGEEFSVQFPLSQKWIDKKLKRFGFSDSYGRYVWTSRKNSKKFIESLKKHLADAERQKGAKSAPKE